MRTGAFTSFLALPEQDRRDVFASAARRLDTAPGYVEKDFWVCLVLQALFNELPAGHPKLLFKGGTSLSKAFGLIQPFSEDIDLVVHRDSLGFSGERDPAATGDISNKKRGALFKDLARACGAYVYGDLTAALAASIGESTTGCTIRSDKDDGDGQTLLVEYPSLFLSDVAAYVSPRVKIEAGARSALEPVVTCSILPYVAADLPGWSFEVENVAALAPERTFWEKLYRGSSLPELQSATPGKSPLLDTPSSGCHVLLIRALCSRVGRAGRHGVRATGPHVFQSKFDLSGPPYLVPSM